MFKAYDYPTRIFHWLFALLFLTTFSIGEFVDDESQLFSYHMISGIMMLGLVIWRIYWGFAGSQTARFSSFKIKPQDILRYFKTLNHDDAQRYLGHNPASGLSALLMLSFALASAATGLLTVLGPENALRGFSHEVHEISGKLLLITAVIHIAGVIYHQIRHDDGLISSMVTGKKKAIASEEEISSNHHFGALILMTFFLVLSLTLFKSYDPSTRILKLYGYEMVLEEPHY